MSNGPVVQLPKGLSFTLCRNPPNSPSNFCGNGTEINREKTASTEVNIDRSTKEVTVYAYSDKDHKPCQSVNKKECAYTFEFKGTAKADLEQRNPELANYIEAEIEKLVGHAQGTMSGGNTPEGSHKGNLDILGTIGIVSLIILVTGLSASYLLSNKYRNRKPQAKRTRPVSGSPSPTTNPVQDSALIAPEILKQLQTQQATLINQNIELSNRVSKIESEMLGLLQQLQLASLRLERVSQPPSPQPSATQPPREEQAVPQSLTVDIIKQAVLTNDYSLLSPYPHDFLTETDRSRQGIEESKKFQIDGNSSHTNGRPQSEFIAINCCGSTYLIPNIVPNCSDPARTIKRHSDMNNIYRRGQGENYLMIKELAEVQKAGSFYELSKDGRIA
jgi:hypothetical protein